MIGRAMRNISSIALRGLWVPVFFLAYQIQVSATHIVGGSMTYNCLGNSKFEITLTLYADCLNGLVDYDKPAWVGVFDAQGNILDTLFIPYSGKADTLELVRDSCFVNFPDLCIRVTSYRLQVTLPFREGGYTLAYQRCCRNGSINNIVDPLETGATYYTIIPQKALNGCNDAPVFVNDPPIFICVNEPFQFDHFAVDTDGDSLVYELLTPYTGGSLLNAQPKPSTPPPFDTVQWLPPYSKENMLGYDTQGPLTINPVTGIMSAIPNTIGQFVVGVKVSEFDDEGQFIGLTFRDFQYNVVSCLNTNAEIFLQDSTYCDEFNVSFKNNSQAGVNYLWDFGDPNNPGASSTEAEPNYTYSDTGTFVVRLIANPGAFCPDTAYATILIQRNSLDVCTDIDVLECEDSLVVNFKDCSIDPISPVIEWNWTISTPDSVYQFMSSENQLVFPKSTEAVITYRAVSSNGCIGDFSDTLQLNLIAPPPLVPDTVNLCYQETATLNPNYDSLLLHLWSPPVGIIGSLNDPNPEILADSSTTYIVTYTDSTGLCQVNREVRLTVLDSLPDLEIQFEIPQCQDSIILKAFVENLSPDLTVNWEVIAIEDVFIGGGTGIEVTLKTSQDVSVCAQLSTATCSKTFCDTVRVNLFDLPELSDTLQICQGDTVALFPGAPTGLIYSWTPPQFLNDPSKPSPLAFPPVSQGYSVAVTDSVGLCKVDDQVWVEVNDSTLSLDFSWDVVCDGLEVQFENSSTGFSLFHWDFGNTTTTTDTSSAVAPSYTYPGSGSYQVTLTTPQKGICPQKDTLVKEIVLEPAVNEADFNVDVVYCGFPLKVSFFGLETSTYGSPTSWMWDFGPYGKSQVKDPSIEVFQSGELEVTLVVTWDDRCSDTITKKIALEIYDLDLPDSFTVCLDSCIRLGLEAQTGFSYSWQPTGWVDDPASADPLICPKQEGDLTVEVSILQPNNDVCQLRDTVSFLIVDCAEEFDCDSIPEEISSCLPEIELSVDPCAPEVVLVWCSPDGDTLGFGPFITVPMEPYDFVLLKKSGPYGFMDVDTVFLNFLEYSIPIEASADPYVIFKGDSTILKGNIPSGVSILWTPSGTLSDPTAQDPEARPDTTTTYTLLITDEFGCRGTDTVTVTVRTPICDDPYIYVPNTFTPNGDKLNDVLFVRGNYIDDMEFYIYNRWGEKVFESKDKDLGWDGRFKGEELGSDVFGYHLRCRCFNGQEYTAKGNVTLLRN